MKCPLSFASALCFLFWPVLSIASERATVKVETASVYSGQRASQDGVVKILKRGDAVVVDLAIASDSGEWCAVSEPDGGARLGYMRCEDLQREPARRITSVRVPDAPPEDKPSVEKTPARRRISSPPLDPVTAAGEDYVQPLSYWAKLFRFTDSQRSSVDELANRMGVTACRRQFEENYRTYAREYEGRGLRRTPEQEQRIAQMVRDLNRFLHPCMLKIVSVLEQFPNLMTPEQKQGNAELLAVFQQQLDRQRKTLTSPDMYPGIR